MRGEVSTMTTPVSLRSVAAAVALSVALGAGATTVRAQDNPTSPSYSVRAAIGREAARLADAGVRRTTYQQGMWREGSWVDRHGLGAGTLTRAAERTTSQQQTVQQERSWVGRHPALTGALIGAGVGATYAYVMCRGACEGQPELYMTVFGGIGAGIGAATGAIVGALRR